MTNSSAGPFESTFARVAPPNRNSVMSLTRIPRATETRAWAISWVSTEPKNSTAAMTARATAFPVDSLGKTTENRMYMLYVMSRAMTTQDVSIRISIPAIRASRHELPNIAERYPGYRAAVARAAARRPPRRYPKRPAPARYRLGHAPRSHAGKASHLGTNTWDRSRLSPHTSAWATRSGEIGLGNPR